MPSPVAHGLAGLALASLVRYIPDRPRPTSLPPADSRLRSSAVLLFTGAMMAAACAPDLDFLPGVLIGHSDLFHRGPSHSLAAATLFGLAAGTLARLGGGRNAGRVGVLLGLAFASHPILDMFSPDPVRFNGVPLLWPLVETHLIVPVPIFLSIERTPGAPSFIASLLVPHNVYAVVWECLIMGGVLAIGRTVLRFARENTGRHDRVRGGTRLGAKTERLDSPS